MAEPTVTPPAPAAPAAPAPPAPPAPTPAAPAPAAPAAPPAPPPDRVLDFDKKLEAAFDKDMGTPAAPAAPATPAPPKPAAPAALRQPKELRAELDRVSGELTTKAKQITDLEAKIVDWEKKGKDTEAMTGRLKTLEQQLESIQAENRALKHESSPEFKKQYEEPFNRAAAYAEKVTTGLEVINPETNQTRPATFDDFMDVYGQKTFNKAVKRAQELFGDASQVVINHVTELQRLQYQRDEALKEERAHAKEREQEEVTKRKTRDEEITGLYEKVKNELADSVEDYKDDPTDKDLTGARKEAYEIFDQRADTLNERILKNAHIRHRFAAYPVLKLKLLRAQKQLAAANKELETYKVNPPDPTRRPGGGEHGTPTEDWAAGLRKAVT